jgi:GTP cyclohydrolase I
MKQNETSWNTGENDEFSYDPIGDNHISTSADTPLREDAFVLDDQTKIELIEKHFREIMLIMGLDLTDDSLKGTPGRVAKMYIKEIFRGLKPQNKPKVTLFENKYHYGEMVLVKDISFYTMCEHHFVPFFGKAHVAYLPKDKVAGLSKVNRLVDFLASRPQVQERLTRQIAEEIRDSFKTEDVAVMLEASHLCVASRGIKDVNSSTITSCFMGKFNCDIMKSEFMASLGKK